MFVELAMMLGVRSMLSRETDCADMLFREGCRMGCGGVGGGGGVGSGGGDCCNKEKCQ